MSTKAVSGGSSFSRQGLQERAHQVKPDRPIVLRTTGSSLAVTLPAEVVKEFKLKKGAEVDVSVHPQTARGEVSAEALSIWLRQRTRRLEGF